MPFIPHTPESLIKRSDSKNPATTCKGITIDGRHCRRDINTTPSSPSNKRASKAGVVAVLAAGDKDHDGAAAYFCWQHKDQAKTLAEGDESGRKAHIVALQNRTSIDTLAERLGIQDLEDIELEEMDRTSKGKKRQGRQARKETLPKKWQDMEGPLLAVPDKHTRPAKAQTRPARKQPKHRQSNLGLFCCIRSVESPEPLPPARPTTSQGIHPQTPKRVSAPAGYRSNSASNRNSLMMPSTPSRPKSHQHTPNQRLDSQQSTSGSPQKGASLQSSQSQTQTLLSLIPQTLPPYVTSALLTELAKPPSALDAPGYIYIFWLTDAADVPDDETASLLLSPSTPNASNHRRESDILGRYPSKRRSSSRRPSSPAPILLKIGRTANVQRRMNQWTRQCGYDLSLVRYYPYQPSSSASPPPQQIPHANKVERLIQLELQELRVKSNCEHCGKEHREWYAVAGTKEGLKAVDEVIRRWVGWDLGW